MKDFWVSYDLIKTKDYQRLWDELKRLDGHRVLESLWEFRSGSTALQIRDHIARFMDSDDRLMVMEVTDWAGRNLISKPATAAA